ncbi:MAG: tRNA lysidine(34) synthetase TilS, partial [Pseudomonadota bacterium]
MSGGSDSLALLNLLRAWGGRPVVAATVDHGLRPGSAEEAQQVAKICATWNVPHAILTWDTDPRGNLQAAARDARRALLRQEAERVSAATIALGHTVEDQAETFLLRLARGSGVDGLSAMAPLREERGIGITWARPLLSTRRADLQSYLTAQGLDWIRDPSNQDTSFDRVRLRQAAPALAELGLGAERLAATADMMGLARDALGQTAQTLAHEAAHPHPLGHLSLDIAPLTRAPLEVALRVLSASFNWVTGTQYRPRLSSLKPALRALGAQPKGALTLHGAQMRWRDGHGILCREPSKCAP